MDSKSDHSGYRQLTFGEEILNSIVHGIGALLSIAALSIMVVFAVIRGDALKIAGVIAFGSSLVILYISSTLYHSLTKPKVKNLFARIDHGSIFLLIAGTYTPFLLNSIRGKLGWILFGIIWGLALGGVVIRSVYLIRFRRMMVPVYLAMGWLFLFILGPLMRSLTGISITLIFAGGLSYSLGVVFYSLKNMKFGHTIWHLLVLNGSILHFFAVFYSLFN